MVNSPVISTIIPVYNSAPYLRKCLDSVLGQGVSLQVICVDDGSDDGSIEILKEYEANDSRVIIVMQENLGAGAARNKGILSATGNYIHYLDSDDWVEDGAYHLILDRMFHSGVDVCIFQKYLYDNETGISKPVVKAFETNCYITDFRTNPNFFTHSPVVPWNKIIRRSIIVDNDLCYDEIVCANDRTFYFSLLSRVTSIMVCREPLIYYRTNNSKSLVGTTRSKHYDAHFHAFFSTMSSIKDCDAQIKEMVLDACMIDMFAFYDKAHIIYKPKIYLQLNKFFRSVDMFSSDYEKYNWGPNYKFICQHTLGFPVFYIKSKLKSSSKQKLNKCNFKGQKNTRQDVIISLTSFPARINSVHMVIKSLLQQTVLPGKIILWLAEEQFPRREKELPQKLLNLVIKGLDIRFCEDLKPHKKYFYAMCEYPDHVIVTVDDDVLYDSDMLELLLISYSKYPNVVSAMRVHRATIRDGKIQPYVSWSYNDDHLLDNPSRYAVATGVGGILYPPHIIPRDAFNADVIKEICLYGDDLWLKANELHNGISTVLATFNRTLRYIDGTQETALWLENTAGGRNDAQLNDINRYFISLGFKSIKSLMTGFGNVIKLSLLVDCTNKKASSEIVDFCDSIPEWAEVIAYGDADTSLVDMLHDFYGPAGRIRFIISHGVFRTPLHVLASIAYGELMLLVDPWKYKYNNEFYTSVMSSHSEKGMVKKGHISNEIGVMDKQTFDPFCIPFLRDVIINLHLNSLCDGISRLVYLKNKDGTSQPIDLSMADIDSRLHCSTELFSMLSYAGYDVYNLEDTKLSDFLDLYECRDVLDDKESFDLRSEFDSTPQSSCVKICPVCGSVSRKFIAGGKKLRDNVECPICGAWERHRSAWAALRSIGVAEGTEIAAVNFPSSMRHIMKQYGVTCYTQSDILARSKSFGALLLCHSIKSLEDVDSISALAGTLSNDGWIAVTIALKKSDKKWIIDNLGMFVTDFMDKILEMGLSVELLTNRDLFEEQFLDRYSLISDESMFIIRKN